jgi:hypothetical protein
MEDRWIELLVSGTIALIAAGGGVKFFLEPMLREIQLRRQHASALWLSCVELRSHLEEVKTQVFRKDLEGRQTKDALLKIPRNDYESEGARWFVQSGYFAMITAYKIASFSAWMRIYQQTLMHYSRRARSKKLMSNLYNRFDQFKSITSHNTILWYYYIDAIGDKITVQEDAIKRPMNFGEFCKNYFQDQDFLHFFDQLHMFIHFLGREEERYVRDYRDRLPAMIASLIDIEEFLRGQNFLQGINIEPRTTTSALPGGTG